jgi:hypothetical protein
VDGRVSFEVASAKQYPGEGYGLVAMFDCLHDMGDAVDAAAHVLRRLTPDGTWMIVAPYAGDRLEDNLNPVRRVYYGGSTLVCTPPSRAQEVGSTSCSRHGHDDAEIAEDANVQVRRGGRFFGSARRETADAPGRQRSP